MAMNKSGFSIMWAGYFKFPDEIFNNGESVQENLQQTITHVYSIITNYVCCGKEHSFTSKCDGSRVAYIRGAHS
jgi:hypothetical protein